MPNAVAETRYGSRISWVLVCFFRWSLRPNRLPQTTQEWGRTPVWIRLCRVSSSFLVNDFPQDSTSHLNGLSPVTMKMHATFLFKYDYFRLRYNLFICVHNVHLVIMTPDNISLKTKRHVCEQICYLNGNLLNKHNCDYLSNQGETWYTLNTSVNLNTIFQCL